MNSKRLNQPLDSNYLKKLSPTTKILFILLVAILFSGCSWSHTYAGKSMSYGRDGINFMVTCAKTPSQKSWSFNPSSIPPIAFNTDVSVPEDLLAKLLAEYAKDSNLSIQNKGVELAKIYVGMLKNNTLSLEHTMNKCKEFLNNNKTKETE